MNFNKFTIKSQEAIQTAQNIAQSLGNQAIETGHLIKSILQVDENVTPFLLKKLGVNLTTFNKAVDSIVASYSKVEGGNAYLSNDVSKALTTAENKAAKSQDEFTSIEHILFGLLNGNDQISRMMKDSGLNQKDLESAILELRKGEKVTSQNAEDNYQSLSKYAINLNQTAKDGKLDPVIGRDEEIRRVLQILSRRTKNNPILIGEPGVGKTAIAEGLAHRIINGDVPENLKSKIIYSLDMGALVAGAKFKGEFEERLKSVVKEVTSANGEIVLFIDEIHTLVGAGKGDGAMDAANILKPALARGELKAIGATTLSEYQKYFEKDKALERRFQKVLVDEPTDEDAISILRGIKEKYETHHKVRIKDEAILAAVELSQRYITDRFLPDKAIDLIDEASSKMRMEMNSMPIELDELERKIRQLEIEREAIKREKDSKKLSHLNKEIAELSDQRNNLKAKWQGEKEVVSGIQKTKEEIENIKQRATQAERDGDFALVAELRYGKLVEAQESLKEFGAKLNELKAKGSVLIKEEVDAEDIAEVVAKWSGIPVSKMLQSERDKLLNLEEELHKRVVGQEEAIQAVSDAVRRSRAGLQDQNRPVGSFLFLGTTGVGKTELAKALADFLFDNENAITRIDMSEYQERHAVSRLVGAPPGYVGYDEGGQLTEAVRRKPYSVILLDEIEKAHPDVFNTLLQVLDDGRLTDNKGRVANFKNTIIIMTSNIGSEIIREEFSNHTSEVPDSIVKFTHLKLMEQLKKTLKPEFLNRIDETVMFLPLNEKDITQIVQLQFEGVQKMLSKQDINISATPEAIKLLAKNGFDPQFGARPVKRVIQREILNALSKSILSGNVHSGSEITIEEKNGDFKFVNN
ncbi:MAG: ATP-dependent chaperone ClpB [Salibacteraceae bacterium]